MHELNVSPEAKSYVQNLLMPILFGFREIVYLNCPESQHNEESEKLEYSVVTRTT